MEPLRFVPFGSAVQPGFWSELTRVKLEVAGLGEEAVEVLGSYTSLAQPSPRIVLDWDAFQARRQACNHATCHTIHGCAELGAARLGGSAGAGPRHREKHGGEFQVRGQSCVHIPGG